MADPPSAATITTSSPDTSQLPTLPSPFTGTTPAPILITQGAEALLYRTHFLTPSHAAALKFRPSKPYRHATLDARLTKQRVLAEARILVKLTALRAEVGNELNVPAVLSLEWDVTRRGRGALSPTTAGAGAWLLMEWIDGASVKDLLRRFDLWVKSLGAERTPEQDEDVKVREDQLKTLLRRIGRAVGALHSKGGVVHGDLTSSNIMIRPRRPPADMNEAADHEATDDISPPDFQGDIFLIDFGLATGSVQDEDRAVDLYVLERAFGSTHPRQEGWFDAEVLQSQDGYRGSFKGAGVVLKRLEDVRLRGRKRSMLG